MKRSTPAMLLLSSLILISAAACPVHAQAPASQETLQQYISSLQANPGDNALREKIIRLAQTMSPAPAIPPEAEKFGNRAEYIIKSAKSDADFVDAAKEYEKALLIAPWVSAYYYNLGVAFEKTNQLADTLRNYKLYLLAAPNAADAQEVKKQIDGIKYALEKTMSWVADPATGCKVGWNNSNFTVTAATWSGPMVSGKAEGKGVLKATLQGKNGKDIQGSGEVEMSAGLLNGKGAMEWSDNHSYNGYFKNGKRNGKGLMKFADGHTYDGEWKDDEQLTATPINVDKILGIPWGASEKEVKLILRERPKTSYWAAREEKPGYKTQSYHSTYNDNVALIQIHFYQGNMWAVSVLLLGVNGDKILEQFNATKQGLSQRYGTPYKIEGLGINSVAYWDLGNGRCAKIRISKDPAPFAGGPVQVIIQYFDIGIANMLNGISGPGAGKDY